MLKPGRFLPIPMEASGSFDHGAYDPATGRVFVAHTSANRLEVLDHGSGRHLRTLTGFPEAAGVVVGGGLVLVTNLGDASMTIVNASTLERKAIYPTSARPNGVAWAPGLGVAMVACVGHDDAPPVLQRIAVETGKTETLPLPGRPRWCVVDAAERRVFCAIREPSAVFVASLDPFVEQAIWPLPSAGGHGIDLDEVGGRLLVACDGGSLVALRSETGQVVEQWPLPGVPDATFHNPDSGRVHVAVGDPGVVVSIDPRTGCRATCVTEMGAKTTALVRPGSLYAFLPRRAGALELLEERKR